MEDFTFYFGVASGSSMKALRQLEEPNIMVSYVTDRTVVWDCENFFVDSGGFSLMLDTGKHGPIKDYIDYVKNYGADTFALQDYPCEPEILEEYGRTVEEHQDMTVERSKKCLDKASGVRAEPVAVLQGWNLSDYIKCIEKFEDAGLLTDYIGIGSVCRRNQDYQLKQIILKIRNQLPNKKLHAFGVKKNVLRFDRVVEALDSADSLAYEWHYGKETFGKTWHRSALSYLKYKRDIHQLVNQSGTAENNLLEV